MDKFLTEFPSTIAWAITGVAILIIAVRAFDRLDRIDFHREIVEDKNSAAAIVLGSFIIGIAMIVSRVV